MRFVGIKGRSSYEEAKSVTDRAVVLSRRNPNDLRLEQLAELYSALAAAEDLGQALDTSGWQPTGASGVWFYQGADPMMTGLPTIWSCFHISAQREVTLISITENGMGVMNRNHFIADAIAKFNNGPFVTV